MIYQWRSEKIKYAVPASTVGKVFEKIEKKKGSVSSKDVLDSARPESSPIHSIFEWDDEKAAEAYRLGQATSLICNLMIVTEENESEEPIKVRAFVNVSDGKEGSYIGAVRAMTDSECREKVLQDAMAELSAFKAKYNHLTEFSKLFTVIDNLKEKIA